jgi:hypothetical protein
VSLFFRTDAKDLSKEDFKVFSLVDSYFGDGEEL